MFLIRIRNMCCSLCTNEAFTSKYMIKNKKIVAFLFEIYYLWRKKNMKKILYSFVAILVLAGCTKPVEQEFEVSKFIAENYRNDARQLYFNEIIADSTHQNYDNYVINEVEVDNILKIIQAVYNLDCPARDSVFEKHQIHCMYGTSFNSLMLSVNTALPEIQNLSQGIIPTNSELLDNLLAKYNFDSVETSYSYPEFSWLTIYTKDTYNLLPVEKEFEKLNSVKNADFSKGAVFDEKTITLTRSGNNATIIFGIGWGDCPAGCINHKYWEFKVTDNTAKFVKSY